MDAVRTTFAPKTASFSMWTPSTTMHLEPTKTSSSIITGAAWSGSKTPPIPTPRRYGYIASVRITEDMTEDSQPHYIKYSLI